MAEGLRFFAGRHPQSSDVDQPAVPLQESVVPQNTGESHQVMPFPRMESTVVRTARVCQAVNQEKEKRSVGKNSQASKRVRRKLG